MERKDSFRTIIHYVDEDGVIITPEQATNYITISKSKTYERRSKHEVLVVWTRIVRKSPQLDIFVDGGTRNSGDAI